MRFNFEYHTKLTQKHEHTHTHSLANFCEERKHNDFCARRLFGLCVHEEKRSI